MFQFRLVLMAMAANAIFFSSTLGQLNSSWLGGSGDWSNGGLWSTENFPNNGNGGFDYNAIVNSGSVSLDQDIVIEGLTLGGATITGVGNLHMNAVSAWPSGIMQGTGTTTFDGGLHLSSASTKTVTGSRVVNTNATTYWTGGDIDLRGTTWNNSGTFHASTDNRIILGSGAPVFNNSGAFIRDVSTGTAWVQTAFNNTGHVHVQSGTLSMTGGGVSTGSFTIDDGAVLSIEKHTLDGATFSGAGTFRVASGSGATITVDSSIHVASKYEHTGLLTGSGTVVLAGSSNWLGGTMTGTGTTNFDGTALLGSSSTKSVTGSRVVNTNATTYWTGGDIDLRGTTWNNSGTFHASTDNRIILGSGAPVFNNSGAFIRDTTTGTTWVQAAFINSGIVEARTGNLQFNNYTQTAGLTVLDGGILTAFSALKLQGGSLVGNGQIVGSVNNSGGLISPGFSAGMIDISGTFTMGSGSSLFIELGGLDQGISFDWVKVGGTATLGGELIVSLIDGFIPNQSDTFTFLTAGSIVGQFDTVTFLGGQSLDMIYLPGSVQITNVNAVPEPSSLMMLCLVGLALLAPRRKRAGCQ